MDDSLKKRLKVSEPDEKLRTLLNRLRTRYRRALRDISSRHENWDRNRDVYQGIRPPDKEDLHAREKDEPEKFILPMTFGQANTFIAFCYLLFNQNRQFYILNPTGSEDYDFRFEAELTLARDLRHNKWGPKLYQLLLDYTTLGIGITKEYWQKDVVRVPRTSETPGMAIGITADPTLETVLKTKYEGNIIENVSPWKFFYDTKFPLTDWQRGEFAGDQQAYHKMSLVRWESEGLVAGTEHIAAMSRKELDERKGTRLPEFVEEVTARGTSKDMVMVTEMQIKLIPREYDLGPEEYYVPFMIWIANDNRIIRIERMGYMHQEFTYNVAQFSPDMHTKINRSLSDVLFDIQDVVTWMINTRIMSVRRGLDGRIVADPDVVDSSALEQGITPVIWTRRGTPKVGVDKFFAQLPYTDTTVKHLEDSQLLMALAREFTGINENAMGQFHGGRRSATEARAVNAGAAGRMKLGASLCWEACLAPQGKKMLINQRQQLSLEGYQRIVGSQTEDLQQSWAAFHPADITDLVGSEDFFVWDSTVESEKGFIAESLQELVIAVLGNPANAQMFGLDPTAMIEEIMELRGVGKISRFRVPPVPVAPNVTEIQQPAGPQPSGAEGAPQVS